MKKNLLFYIFFNFGILFSLSVLFSLSNDCLETLSLQKFSNTKALNQIIGSNNSGKWFELESALWLDKYIKEKVSGFELDFTVWQKDSHMDKNNFIQVPLSSGELFELKTTELDVITSNYVIESKSVPVYYATGNANMTQFLKEKNFLDWLSLVYQEYMSGSLITHITISLRKERIILTLCGECTANQEVSLFCSWINRYDEETYEDDEDAYVYLWFQLIKSLSEKKLIVMFKNKLSEDDVQKLRQNNIFFVDEIEYFQTPDDGANAERFQVAINI